MFSPRSRKKKERKKKPLFFYFTINFFTTDQKKFSQPYSLSENCSSSAEGLSKTNKSTTDCYLARDFK